MSFRTLKPFQLGVLFRVVERERVDLRLLLAAHDEHCGQASRA